MGPWLGSMGAFCGKWGDDAYVHGEWCFILPTQKCDPNARSQYISTRGYPMIRSTAPCSHQVDSRSALVLQGHAEMLVPLKYTALLGAALLLLAGAGSLLYAYPSQETKYQAVASNARNPVVWEPAQDMRPRAAAPTGKSTFNVQRFQDAQAQAVNKLSRDTPEPLRIQIYAFFKQATEGDVQGDRPTYFHQKERAKYDAWAACRGMTFDQAVDRYCAAVSQV
ncbi:unnamed protein product [Effrenium voratum]|nr:unnamed protein product [Effrenium voratum]